MSTTMEEIEACLEYLWDNYTVNPKVVVTPDGMFVTQDDGSVTVQEFDIDDNGDVLFFEMSPEQQTIQLDKMRDRMLTERD